MDEATLRNAIDAVIDPVFDRSLGELGTVANVAIEGSSLSVTLIETAPNEAHRREVTSRVEAATRAAGAVSVTVTFELRIAARETPSEDPIPGVKNVVLVVSGKGGVGKSTVATNLALALRNAGTRVGLLDADVYGPSLPTMLGIHGQPLSDDGVHIRPLDRFGIKLMSIGFLIDDPKQALIWRGPRLHGTLNQLLTQVVWGPLDYLVIDTPPGTGDVAITLTQKVKPTGAVVVTTPQEVALQDVYKSVSMLQKLDVPILGVIENMSWFVDPAGGKHFIFGEGGGKAIAEQANAPLLGQIPIDARVREWGDKGVPIVESAPSVEASVALKNVAESLANEIAIRHFKRAGGARAIEASKRTLRIVR